MAEMSTIAVIATVDGPHAQALLAEAAGGWSAAGARVVGVLARSRGIDEVCSAGYLRDLGSGADHVVHLDTPPAGTSCHLDIAGMEAAGAALLGQIPAADLVVLSKFGKLEAMEQGLWAAFTAARAAGKPLLTTVSSRHLAAWKAFAPDATWLEADRTALAHWWRAMQVPTARRRPHQERPASGPS